MDRRGWIVAGALTTGLAASAQEPMPVEVPASAPVVACTPGRCSHRTFLARRRCKRHLQEAFIGFPEEFERPPLGAALYAANKVQVGNGEAARMVFSNRDFGPGGGGELSDAGRARLEATLGLLPTNFAPVVVERTGDDEADRRRRDALLSALNLRSPFAVPPERVVLGRAIARGLGGEEVEIIRQTRLDRTRARGPALNSVGTDSGGQSPTLPQLEQAGPNETQAPRPETGTDPQPLPAGSTPPAVGSGPR